MHKKKCKENEKKNEMHRKWKCNENEKKNEMQRKCKENAKKMKCIENEKKWNAKKCKTKKWNAQKIQMQKKYKKSAKRGLNSFTSAYPIKERNCDQGPKSFPYLVTQKSHASAHRMKLHSVSKIRFPNVSSKFTK